MPRASAAALQSKFLVSNEMIPKTHIQFRRRNGLKAALIVKPPVNESTTADSTNVPRSAMPRMKAQLTVPLPQMLSLVVLAERLL